METKTNTKTFEISSEDQRNSEFTLLVYFKPLYATNGAEKGRKFHSLKYEWVEKNGVIVQDQKFAYNHLTNLLLKELTSRYVTGLIFHNPTKTTLLHMAYNVFKGGKQIEFKADNSGKGSVFHAIK